MYLEMDIILALTITALSIIWFTIFRPRYSAIVARKQVAKPRIAECIIIPQDSKCQTIILPKFLFPSKNRAMRIEIINLAPQKIEIIRNKEVWLTLEHNTSCTVSNINNEYYDNY